ncbi:hypothetical protein SAMN04488129_10757 [Halomonas daqiaonensis]|uniref:Uncharacterized protein n=1 Tax=Halomonas daqiaonensis TaxID=650850 RepID=A0A1H7MSE2_9GAMM|nr:hypothetical protein SAMN04488129_10757 [Halomonas daqiaonensis]
MRIRQSCCLGWHWIRKRIIANTHIPIRLLRVDTLGDLSLFDLSLSPSLLTVLMQTSQLTRETAEETINEKFDGRKTRP